MNPKVDRKQAILNSGIMAEVVRQLFPDARKTGEGQIIARCPFHPDSNPSLSIQSESGLFKCFACGEKGNGFDLYMKMKNCDFKQAIFQIEALAGIHYDQPAKKQRPQVVATFYYHNEAGHRRYYKKRFEPGYHGRSKSFAFYHLADGKEVKGRGGDPLLYNLPGILKVSEHGQIFFVEGERKADILNGWGLCATSIDSGGQSGKGSTWRKEWSEYFAGKEVVIVPDNDPTGDEYAASITERLLGVADSVKILRLPGLPVKGDIIDWVNLQEGKL